MNRSKVTLQAKANAIAKRGKVTGDAKKRADELRAQLQVESLKARIKT